MLSSATAEGGQHAANAAMEITAAHANLPVLAGRPGDSLHDLLQQARSPRHPGAGPER